MKILLSIKPQFANLIFEGIKKFEFRKAIPKNKDAKTVLVYASAPVKMVIVEFEIETILCDDPQNLWHRTKKGSGISEDFFFDYFADKDIAYAIKIKNYKLYRKPICIKEEFNAVAPQSYRYLI